ncbi:MAG: PEP-CTERM sorting domain-containing protein [Alphaproteobacteria bacterium]|nr:PEP-CTERM sorting domain-containing protein [Alphaproteobacteria bacterium]
MNSEHFPGFKLGLAAAGLTVTLGAGPALAVPNLQFYVEGATYCTEAPDSCPISVPNSSGAGPFKDTWAISGVGGLRLWIVGNTSIFDLHFVASYNSAENVPPPGFDMTSVTIGDPLTVKPWGTVDQGYVGAQNVVGYPFGGNTDPVFDPTAPAAAQSSVHFPPPDPLLPIVAPPLTEEGKTGAGRGWRVFFLGDMTSNEACAFNTEPGDDPFLNCGGNQTKTLQVNVYDITFPQPAAVGQVVNFDLFACEFNGYNDNDQSAIVTKDTEGRETQNGCTLFSYNSAGKQSSKTGWASGPNSHDAQWLQLSVSVPEPAALGLFGLGLIGFAVARGARKR